MSDWIEFNKQLDCYAKYKIPPGPNLVAEYNSSNKEKTYYEWFMDHPAINQWHDECEKIRKQNEEYRKIILLLEWD